MTSGRQTVSYPAKDLAHAKKLSAGLLGAEPAMDEPYHVGFRVGNQDVGLDPRGHSQGMTRPVGYWHVDDIQASLQLLLVAGGAAQQAVRDVGGGKLIASVTDPDGNVLGPLPSP